MPLSDAAVAFSESRIDVAGSTVRYLEGGEGEPVIVLHGDEGLYLNRTHELLAEQVRVVALEIPGFDGSASDEQAGSLQDLAVSVLEMIDALGIERFSLVGISFGAALASWIATESAQRIDKLVLIASSAIRDEAVEIPESTAPDELKRFLFAHPDEHELPFDREGAEKGRAMLSLLLPPRNPELEERLSTLEVPTLVVFGADDVVTPPELGRHYVELIPEAFHAIVYDAGHAVDIERPEATAEIVADFLNRGSTFTVEQVSSLQFP